MKRIIRGSALVGVIGLMHVPGCGGSVSGDRGSETHWLACVDDSDCPTHAQCINGYCEWDDGTGQISARLGTVKCDVREAMLGEYGDVISVTSFQGRTPDGKWLTVAFPQPRGGRADIGDALVFFGPQGKIRQREVFSSRHTEDLLWTVIEFDSDEGLATFRAPSRGNANVQLGTSLTEPICIEIAASSEVVSGENLDTTATDEFLCFEDTFTETPDGILPSPGPELYQLSPGEYCVLSAELSPDFPGTDVHDVVLQTDRPDCGGTCLAYHFQGRSECDTGLDCEAAGTAPVTVPVEPQLVARPAIDALFCSCRCAGPGPGPFCQCGEDMECAPTPNLRVIDEAGAFSEPNEDLIGSYCVPSNSIPADLEQLASGPLCDEHSCPY